MSLLKFLIVVVFLGWFIWFAYTNFDEAFGPDDTSSAAAIVCSQDVGFCPDGSMVERTGPNCTFAPCE